MMPAPLSATRPVQPCGIGTTVPFDVTTKSVVGTLLFVVHRPWGKRPFDAMLYCSIASHYEYKGLWTRAVNRVRSAPAEDAEPSPTEGRSYGTTGSSVSQRVGIS